jgi:hypothetical protein
VGGGRGGTSFGDSWDSLRGYIDANEFIIEFFLFESLEFLQDFVFIEFCAESRSSNGLADIV